VLHAVEGDGCAEENEVDHGLRVTPGFP
jgi:hypothetical protein